MKHLWDQTSLWQSPITERLSRHSTITRESFEKNKIKYILKVALSFVIVFTLRSRSVCSHQSPFKTANKISFTVQKTSPVAHPGTVSVIPTRYYRFETKNHRNTNNSMALVLNKHKCRRGIQMLMCLYYSYNQSIKIMFQKYYKLWYRPFSSHLLLIIFFFCWI